MTPTDTAAASTARWLFGFSRPKTGTPPSALRYRTNNNRRNLQLAVLAALISLAVGGSFVAFGIDSPILPTVLLIALVAPVVLWHFPRAALFTLFGATCLIEIFQTPYKDALTDRIPFFWNINTVFQIYAGVNFKALPVSPLELLLALAFACTALRSVFSGTARLKGGPLLIPIGIYLGFVVLGWINGIATGGDFKLSLQEVRAQFYFGIAYLMAVYMAAERRTVRALFWTMSICIVLKAGLYAFRRFVTLAGQPIPDQGVGSHEEAFFFVSLVSLLAVLAFTGTGRNHPLRRLHGFLWATLPITMVGLLVTNRRAGTAAIVTAVLLLLVSAFRAFPARRRAIAWIGAILAVLGTGYYQAFKNSDSVIAQPARAIHSQFAPDERDAASNAYRDAENANIMATVKQSPATVLIGYGYGKRMLHVVPMADISDTYEWWDLLPHNQILWVWMRVGTLGFFAFWMMIAAILLRACQVLRAGADAVSADAAESRESVETRQIALFCLLLTSSLLLFGLLDLQLSNFRDMLFAGIWTGVLAGLPLAEKTTRSVKRIYQGDHMPR